MRRLSVALCTYNGEMFIQEQLDSILYQELPVDEIVICDDCSSDGTIEIVKKTAERNPQIVWNIQINGSCLGVTKNFEKALSLCTGDIIFLSDQDDRWHPYKAKKMAAYFAKHPSVKLLFSDAELINEKGKIISNKTVFDIIGLKSLADAWDAGLQFEIENTFQRLLGCTMGIRKDFLERTLPFHQDVQNRHDGQLAMQAVADNCCSRIDECLTQYRLHQNNVCGLGWKSVDFFSMETTNYLSPVFEPREINMFFLLSCSDNIRSRVNFYAKRKKSYCIVTGKIILALSFMKYIFFYKRYWWQFYFSDLLYGVSSSIRKIIVEYK